MSFLDNSEMSICSKWPLEKADQLSKEYANTENSWCHRHICTRLGVALLCLAAVVTSTADVVIGLLTSLFGCWNAAARNFAFDQLKFGIPVLLVSGTVVGPLIVIAKPDILPTPD
jgi:hypothetical protein